MVDQLGTVEQPVDLLVRAAARHEGVGENLVERPAAMVLAQDVLRHALLDLRPGRQERERAPDCLSQTHGRDCIVAT